ncbi:helix-turn-helix transcriptional regulator [Streptomyces sp. URMC 126]|uniref:helix-turn-helix transcriptional regulator n=1 Tax=Streptomyces sp. URMC 126 TaxID=3423401 RepID=UPI003F1ADEDB
MAIAKAERLMNLALCLLGTRRPLSKRELRGSIEAYLEAFGPGNDVASGPVYDTSLGPADEPDAGPDAAAGARSARRAASSSRTAATGSDDAFNRMFERDKEDLRELGLIIETVEGADGETGYLARRDSNRLPPITLDVEESAALGLAAKVWQQARLASAASGALQKLRAAGMPLAEDAYEGGALETRIPVHEAAFEPLMLAARDRRTVVFDYRKANAARPEQRHVEPWTLECWRGHWYLAGWDRDRQAERVFRLSRITGRVRSRALPFTAPVPDHVTVRETVESWAGETATGTALIKVRAGHGYPLRAKALNRRDLGDGWDELEIPYGHGLDAWLVEFGPDVVVLEPDDLRADVVERLRAVAKD